MKWKHFFGGLLIGCSIGLMVGAAIVQLPEDGHGQRKYPVFLSMLLAMVGVIGLRPRRLWP
jgi:hypothetical protein